MRLPKSTSDRRRDGFSLVEGVFACALVAVFFIGLFGMNSQCLLFANSSRELQFAGQSIQSRMEQLRASNWATVTTATGTSSVQTLFTPAVPGADRLGTVTEVVTISKYPAPPSSPPTPIQMTRTGSGTGNVTPSLNSPTISTTTLSSVAEMVQINLQWTWQSAPNARARSMTSSTIYGKNTQQ